VNDGAAGPLVGVIGMALIVVAVKVGEKLNDNHKRKVRNKTPPICVWQYSADEWQHLVDTTDLADTARGSAIVRITPTDIWIDDNSSSLRKELIGYRKYVTACKFEGSTLSLRVRSTAKYVRSNVQVMYCKDYRLPVPIGHEEDASKVVKYFSKWVADNPVKVANVSPKGNGATLFGEQGF